MWLALTRSVGAIVLIACACLTSGCPRAYPKGEEPPQAKGSHPWDKPGYVGDELRLSEKNREPQPGQEAGGHVEARPERGPALPEQDSFDIDKMNGTWLVVAATHDEKQDLLDVSDQDTFIFESGRSVIFHSIFNWKDKVMMGDFKKLRPGVIGIRFGGGTFTEFYGMLFRDDFMYLWNYEKKTGYWMARLPEQVTERVEANKFDTTRGPLQLTDVVATSYSGKVGAPDNMTIHGFYNRGVLSIRWEKDDRSGGGYAAFVVGPDWKTLKGAWWIDDYEAIPFSDKWDGTRQ